METNSQIRSNFYKLFEKMQNITNPTMAKLFYNFVIELNKEFYLFDTDKLGFINYFSLIARNCNVDGKLFENSVKLINDFDEILNQTNSREQLEALNYYFEYMLK